jgi:hypothetical protein
MLMHNFEILTKRPWGNILLCSKGNEWQCSIVNRFDNAKSCVFLIYSD